VVAVPSGMAAKVKTQVLRDEPLLAPVAQGQQLATLRVTAAEQPVVDVPLLALDAVGQAGMFGRAWDAMRLWIR
jgi:serine-type D-Ala-D-Ala carboxypeptidase (penicillin-binding protein 5/6)